MATGIGMDAALEIADRVERFVREEVIPYESDPRRDDHGAPLDEMVMEMREKARAAGVLTPHILADGRHLSQRETATVLKASGLSPLGPVAVNTMAPDEGNMYLLGKVGSPEMKERFLKPMVEGRARSAFFMTEPAELNGAGAGSVVDETASLFEHCARALDRSLVRLDGRVGMRFGRDLDIGAGRRHRPPRARLHRPAEGARQ